MLTFLLSLNAYFSSLFFIIPSVLALFPRITFFYPSSFLLLSGFARILLFFLLLFLCLTFLVPHFLSPHGYFFYG